MATAATGLAMVGIVNTTATVTAATGMVTGIAKTVVMADGIAATVGMVAGIAADTITGSGAND